MSHQSTHHHSLLKSIPQTHHHHHQPNLTAPIKPENDSDDDDLVFLCSVPKVPHTPEDYDPECQCSTCQLVRRLLAKCTCEECRGQQKDQVNQGQVAQSSENVPIANAVSPTNGQPSSSSIQNNDASTSEHTNANDQNYDSENSTTPDLPRLFDDERGDSSLDDSEDDDDSVDKNDSSDNESANSDDDRTDLTTVKCPKCPRNFLKIPKLLCHYRGVHQEWKPYYCRWPKCNFTSAVDHLVITHADRAHFKSQNRPKAKKYVAKREETPPKDSVLEQIVAMKFDNEKKISCPRCGRNLPFWCMENHIRTHANSGYRCAWPNCGFFYSLRTEARKHLCFDYLRVEKANLQQTKRYLVKVDPNLPNSNGLHDTIQNNDASTSEHTNANDQDDDRSRSSTPDYLPRFFDDESRDSSSDDSGVDQESESLNSIVDSQPSTSYEKVAVTNVDTSDSSDNESKNSDDESTESTPAKCPKCAKTFTGRKLFRHYRRVHQEWKPYYCRWPKCNFVAREGDIVITHAYMKHFKSQNRQKARKCVAKRDETPPKDPVLEKIAIKFGYEISYRIGTITRSVCSQCGRNLPSDHINRHIRTHANTGYRCTWPNCGFFFSYLPIAQKHICADHLKRESVNSQQTNRYLVKVNPKTGKTAKVVFHRRNQRDDKNLDNVWHEEDSNSNADLDESSLNFTNEFINLDDEDAVPATVKCPKCVKNFTEGYKLHRHYRAVHQEWKPYYCRWPKCTFVSAIDDIVVRHVDMRHFNSQNRRKAKKYVGIRDEAPPNDPVLKQIIAIKSFNGKTKRGGQTCG